MRKRLKKITGALQKEIQKEVDSIVGLSLMDRNKLGHIDLESLEVHIRSSMHRVGEMWLPGYGILQMSNFMEVGTEPVDKICYPQICRTPSAHFH